MTNKELVNKVKDWAMVRGLDKSDPRAQHMKIVEELKELIENVLREDKDEVIDAIGDMQVALIVYCLIRDIEYPETRYQYFFDLNFFDFNGALLDLTADLGWIAESYNKQSCFVEKAAIHSALDKLDAISEAFGVRKEFCLEEAYKVIANRRGKMINDIFVKEEDLK